MNKLKFKIKPHAQFAENFLAPVRATPGSACFDIFAQEDITITNITDLKDLGFSASFAEEYVCLLLPRSGHGTKQGTTLGNTVGVIDADYRGTWMAGMYLNGRGSLNHGVFFAETYNEGHVMHTISAVRPMTFKRGERILQALFLEKVTGDVEIVDTLDTTERGEGGFGHSGN